MVATDAWLLLNQSSTKGPAMGARVMWNIVGIHRRPKRVDGQHSSTRAALVAIVKALKFHSHDLQPAEHNVMDSAIIATSLGHHSRHVTLRELKLRVAASSKALFLKVHLHCCNLFHEKADRLATVYICVCMSMFLIYQASSRSASVTYRILYCAHKLANVCSSWA